MQVFNKMKKLLIISGIILSLLAVTMALYFFLIKTGNNTLNGKKTSLTDFFPFGQENPTVEENNGFVENENTEIQNEDFKQKLRLISRDPVSGFTFVSKNDGLYIRYVEKGTGHIYDVSTFSEKRDRISNKTILNTQKVYFTNKGNSFVAQYLKDNNIVENNFIDILNSSSTEDSILVKSLSPFIESVSSGQDNGNLFYFIRRGSDSFGFISKSPKYTNTQIWTDKLKQLIPQFINDNLITLTTKPNYLLFGYAYTLSPKGDFKQILGPVYGLTTKTDSFGEKMLFNETFPEFNLYSFDIKTDKVTLVSPKTFPEKCVFSLKEKNIAYCGVPEYKPEPDSLDNWYLGTIGFSDEIWKYDLKNNVSDNLINLSEQSGKVLDIDEIYIDKENNFLIFKNKSDGGSLWSFNLQE